MSDQEEPRLNLDEQRRGAFVITDGDKQLAEMVLAIVGDDLVVYHTEVAPEAEGQGLAKKLLNAMVAYARKSGLKVIPQCSFVYAQFKRHPQEFEDVWGGR